MKKPLTFVLLLMACCAFGQKTEKKDIPCDSTVMIPQSLIIDEFSHQKFTVEFTHEKPVEYYIEIVDIVGLRVFHSDDYQQSWNGSDEASRTRTVVKHGTYRWEITYRYASMKEKITCKGKVIMNTKRN